MTVNLFIKLCLNIIEIATPKNNNNVMNENYINNTLMIIINK